MPRVSQAERNYSYYMEVVNLPEPTAEEFGRGLRLADGLAKIRDSLLNGGDEHLELNWSSLNYSRIIVFPAYPIEREITRADGFYEYTSPHEITESATPLAIASFKIIKSELTQPDLALISGRSPSYTTQSYGFSVVETCTVDLQAHPVAVPKISRT